MPYNVQLELQPKGEMTGAVQLDFEQVHIVRLGRRGGSIEQVEFVVNVGNAIIPLIFEDKFAKQALEAWKKYKGLNPERKLHFEGAEAAPGQILVPHALMTPKKP